MNEIDCTCAQVTCYLCRRQAIDATALAIVEREIRWCTGMTGFDIQAHAWRMAGDYRSKAINALAMEFLEY